MSELVLSRGFTSEALQSDQEEGWEVMATRNNDGLSAVLRTLGKEAMANTLSWVSVDHVNGVSLDKKGPLQEIAPIYMHPMAYVTTEQARTAYPPSTQIAA